MQEKIRFSAFCEWCRCTTTVEADPEYVDEPVYCPMCWYGVGERIYLGRLEVVKDDV